MSQQTKFSGKLPPAMMQALKEVRAEKESNSEKTIAEKEVITEKEIVVETPTRQLPQQPPKQVAKPQFQTVQGVQVDDRLQKLLEGVSKDTHKYGSVELPSRGVFYNNKDGPVDGIIHLRTMTGAEEKLMTDQRLLNSGEAFNLIYNNCMQENYKSENFLSVDRRFLLIWLRGISYGHLYTVNVTCEACKKRFPTNVNLDQLEKSMCPEWFKDPLEVTLPVSGYVVKYHLSRGKDEMIIQATNSREQNQINKQGDAAFLSLTQLIDRIEDLDDKKAIPVLLKALHIKDLNFLRNTFNNPPFGVNEEIFIDCPYCNHKFEIDLPYERDFFLPSQHQEVAENLENL